MALLKLLFRKFFPQCSDIDCEKACQSMNEMSSDPERISTPADKNAAKLLNAPGLADLTSVPHRIPDRKKVTSLNPAHSELDSVVKPVCRSALPQKSAPGVADLTGVRQSFSRNQKIPSSNPTSSELDSIHVVSAQIHCENETLV